MLNTQETKPNELALRMVEILRTQRDKLQRQWQRDPIANLRVDGLLPDDMAHAVYEAFPRRMDPRRGLGEHRYVSERLDQCAAVLRDVSAALRDPTLVATIASITGMKGLVAEARTSGISRMDRGHFLNPHVDRSHDPLRTNQQVLSLLYYVTPDLRLVDGGHLELWHNGPEAEPTTILSKFNRLVIMATHGSAWHSVSPVRSARQRCCVWTYYHAPYSLQPQNDNHLPVFRGRPEQRLRDLMLRADSFARASFYRLLQERGLEEQPAHAALPEPSFEEVTQLPVNEQVDRPS